MSTPSWMDLGYLTPDAPECQRDVWALLALLQQRLADVLEEVAIRTAEPSWAASFREGRDRARFLADDLATEAGGDRLRDDEIVSAFSMALDEVVSSGHVPSLLVTGYAVLGELGTLPARLLQDVAGKGARPRLASVAASQAHRSLAGALSAVDPADRERDGLRRLIRHLNGELFGVLRTWRQTFHVLGVDGEVMEQEARTVAGAAAASLGLKFTRADERVFAAGRP